MLNAERVIYAHVKFTLRTNVPLGIKYQHWDTDDKKSVVLVW